jgi:putative ABC transport system substrate-binding protein
LASELVQRPVTLIVAAAPSAVLAVKAATTTIPIVFVIAQDPVALGLVASLSRPGGHLTGVNFLNAELDAKRLELLHALVPGAARVYVIVNPADVANTEATLRQVQPAGRAMGLEIQVLNALAQAARSIRLSQVLHANGPTRFLSAKRRSYSQPTCPVHPTSGIPQGARVLSGA